MSDHLQSVAKSTAAANNATKSHACSIANAAMDNILYGSASLNQLSRQPNIANTEANKASLAAIHSRLQNLSNLEIIRFNGAAAARQTHTNITPDTMPDGTLSPHGQQSVATQNRENLSLALRLQAFGSTFQEGTLGHMIVDKEKALEMATKLHQYIVDQVAERSAMLAAKTTRPLSPDALLFVKLVEFDRLSDLPARSVR